ncbi:MAG: hypothetical protein EOO74_12095, partial [Myxococcales bacterium]
MLRNLAEDRAVGKAGYATEIAKLRVRPLGTQTVTVSLHDGERRYSQDVEASVFLVEGSGMEEARFFTALDPLAPRQPAYVAGEIHMGT